VPEHADALHLLGLIEYQTQHFDSAKILIQKAIRSNNHRADFYNNLGLVCKDVGQYGEAIGNFHQALNIKPDYAEAFNNMGILYVGMQEPEQAEQSFRKAIDIKPDYIDARNNLTTVLIETNQFENIRDIIDTVLIIDPANTTAINNMGLVYKIQGHFQQAKNCFNQVIEYDSNFREAYNNLGNLLFDNHQYDEAIENFDKAINIDSNYYEAFNNKANVLLDLDRHSDAIKNYEKALSLKPDFLDALKNAGIAWQDLGETEKALAYYQKVLEQCPEHAETLHYISVNETSGLDPAALETYINNCINDKDKAHLYFAYANCLLKNKSYEKAFQQFTNGNTIIRRSIEYEKELNSNYIDSIIDYYPEEFFRDNSFLVSDSELPVFIVGMPRSGTTLIEQIVSCHRLVYGAGELTALPELEETYFKCSVDADLKQNIKKNTVNLSKITDAYLKTICRSTTDEIRVTDKLPGNFFRIALIKILLPNAKVIHCQRFPLDTCVSIYTNYFAQGYKFAYDLDELGHYYLDYHRLMQHWIKLFQDEILEVSYENLINDIENESRRMFSYLNLDWDASCLEFQDNSRAVKTASNVQIRQGLFKHSSGRWKHFASELRPLQTMFRNAGII